MRNTSKIRLILPAFASIFLLSCAAQTSKVRPGAADVRRTDKESRFDPLGFPGDTDILTAGVPAVNDKAQDADRVSRLPSPAPDNDQASQEFAVQVFASKSSAEANDFRNSIVPLFNEEVRIIYQQPYYKVCVGKTSGFDEGEALLKKVKAMGYPKAWLVRIRE